MIHGNIVKSHRSPHNRFYRHRILCRHPFNAVCGFGDAAFIVFRQPAYSLCAEKSVAQPHFRRCHRTSLTCRQRHGYCASGGLFAVRRHHYNVSGRVSKLYGSILKKIAPALKPCEVVNFTQCMVVVVRRIERVHKGGAVNTQRLVIALCYKIISVIGVRIARTLRRRPALPRHGTLRMEKPATVERACRHLLKVVVFYDILFQYLLVLQRSAITVDLHL